MLRTVFRSYVFRVANLHKLEAVFLKIADRPSASEDKVLQSRDEVKH